MNPTRQESFGLRKDGLRVRRVQERVMSRESGCRGEPDGRLVPQWSKQLRRVSLQWTAKKNYQL